MEPQAARMKPPRCASFDPFQARGVVSLPLRVNRMPLQLLCCSGGSFQGEEQVISAVERHRRVYVRSPGANDSCWATVCGNMVKEMWSSGHFCDEFVFEIDKIVTFCSPWHAVSGRCFCCPFSMSRVRRLKCSLTSVIICNI